MCIFTSSPTSSLPSSLSLADLFLSFISCFSCFSLSFFSFFSFCRVLFSLFFEILSPEAEEPAGCVSLGLPVLPALMDRVEGSVSCLPWGGGSYRVVRVGRMIVPWRRRIACWLSLPGPLSADISEQIASMGHEVVTHQASGGQNGEPFPSKLLGYNLGFRYPGYYLFS